MKAFDTVPQKRLIVKRKSQHNYSRMGGKLSIESNATRECQRKKLRHKRSNGSNTSWLSPRILLHT